MQVIVNELLTQYRIEGKGKLVVVVHGWGDSSAGVRDLQDELSRYYRVLAINLPGFGGSQAPLTTWGLTDYAQFVHSFLHKTTLKPYALIGHSNGGAILIRALSQQLLTADKLVLLASAGIRNEQNGRKQALQLAVKGGKFLSRPLPFSLRQKLRQKTYQAVGSDMLVVEQLQESFKKIVADDVQQDASTLTLPTLLIYGINDQATPLRYGRMLHKAIPGSTLKTVAAAGHFVHQDQPSIVNQYIEEFLQ
jgi:pimeloyl-ACP methyl ester carboxylesterase